jgi:hypothetical protein
MIYNLDKGVDTKASEGHTVFCAGWSGLLTGSYVPTLLNSVCFKLLLPL